MNEHIPYTYYIAWSDLGVQYYGVRYASGCHPDDFWTAYWTSSPYVREYRERFGDPDIRVIHRTFPNDPDSARAFETQFLRNKGVVESESWLNQSDRPGPPHKHFITVCRLKDKKEMSMQGYMNWINSQDNPKPHKNTGVPSKKKGIPQQKQVCRLDDKLEMTLANFMNWYKRQLDPTLKYNHKVKTKRHKGRPRAKVVCRLSDRKEMDIANFIGYLKRIQE